MVLWVGPRPLALGPVCPCLSSSLGALFDYRVVVSSVIEEANWLTLPEDIPKPGDGFDAVICLGNSFAHLPDFKGN